VPHHPPLTVSDKPGGEVVIDCVVRAAVSVRVLTINGNSAGGGEMHPDITPCLVVCVYVCPADTEKLPEDTSALVALPSLA
jgi:hypothetical protein